LGAAQTVRPRTLETDHGQRTRGSSRATWQADLGEWKGENDADEAGQRQESKAVRGAEEQRHVKAARRTHRQRTDFFEPRREEVGLGRGLASGWHGCAAQGRGTKGRPSRRAIAMSPTVPSFRISPGRRGASRTLRLEGELDLSTASAVRDALGELLCSPKRGAIEIDCRDLVYIDSTGLGVLVAAQKRASSESVSFRLICPNPDLLRLLDMTGLRDFFDIGDE
jgi:anti-sigma B factor antagonist